MIIQHLETQIRLETKRKTVKWSTYICPSVSSLTLAFVSRNKNVKILSTFNKACHIALIQKLKLYILI